MAIITKLFSKRLLISTCIIFLIFGVSFGQSENKVLNDSIVDEIKSIKAADIPVESGEQIKRLQKLAENTVTKEEIESFKMQNDSLINLLDSLIVVDNIVNLKDQTTRYLSNRITFWQKFSNYYQSFNSDITDEVKLIDNSKKRLEKDIVRWKKTNTQIKSQDVNSGLIPRLERVLGILDSTKRDLNEKSDNLLVILNQATQGNFQIQSHLKSIDDVLSENNKQIFVQNEPSLFSSEYWNKTKTNFLEPIQTFYNTEVLDGIGFFSDRLLEVSIQILLIIVLFIIFNAISKNLRRVDYESHSTYRKFLVKIIARSFSASIVIIVFFSSVFFSNRPEVIKDLQIIIISIPIVLIAKTFVNSKFYFYLNIFWILILFNVVYVIFPPDNIYYMIILMLSALLELFVLWKLFWYFYKIKGLISFINILSVTIIIINFGFAVFGVFGLLFGSTTMAELALNMPVFTAYSGLLIFSSMIILNGLISFFLETKYAKNLNVIAVFGDIIKKRVLAIVNLILILIWFYAILNVLNIRRDFMDWFTSILTYEIVLGSASFAFSDILLFFFVIYASVIISRILMTLLERDILTQFNLGKGLPHTIAVMVKYAIISIGVFLAITAVGMPMNSITVIAGAMGVGIGFGLQNIFNNIVSGFILLFERPIQIDDTIEVGTLIGKVKSIGIRASNIRTFDGADIIVPNGDLVSNQVVNWTLSDQQRRIEVFAGVAYGSDPHRVKELFEKVLSDHKDILNDPKPLVLFNGLGNSSLDFRLLFWTSNFYEWIHIKSDIIFGVHDILYKEGISIPFPQMDLHLKSIESPLEISKKYNKESS